MYASGANFSLSELGTCTPPEPIDKGIRPEVWQMVLDAANANRDETPPEEVLSLLEQRRQVRADKNFAESDRLRDEISALGWVVKDSKEGQQLTKT